MCQAKGTNAIVTWSVHYFLHSIRKFYNTRQGRDTTNATCKETTKTIPRREKGFDYCLVTALKTKICLKFDVTWKVQRVKRLKLFTWQFRPLSVGLHSLQFWNASSICTFTDVEWTIFTLFLLSHQINAEKSNVILTKFAYELLLINMNVCARNAFRFIRWYVETMVERMPVNVTCWTTTVSQMMVLLRNLPGLVVSWTSYNRVT